MKSIVSNIAATITTTAITKTPTITTTGNNVDDPK